jgi:c-di-GMP-binding flagellar brake protein YcgR
VNDTRLHDQRRSERVIPAVSEDDIVIINFDHQTMAAKLLDFSEGGLLAYLLKDQQTEIGGKSVRVSLHHEGKVFWVSSRVLRHTGRIVGFEFLEMDDATRLQVRAKLIRLDVEWTRLCANF